MDEQSDRLRHALTGGIIGEALGSAFDGMSRGHIRSVFRDIPGFVDPFPALKGRELQWKKPGLYTAPSQMALLLCLQAGLKGHGKPMDPSGVVNRALQAGAGPHGIFRNPDPLMAGMLSSYINAGDETAPSNFSPPGHLPPLHLFLPFMMDSRTSGKDMIMSALRHALTITRDDYALAGSAMLSAILYELLNSGPELEELREVVTASVRSTVTTIIENSARVFDMKLNPDRIAARAEELSTVIVQLPVCSGPPEAEKIILTHAARHIKGNITRATVHHPLVLAPYIIAFFISYARNPRDGFFSAASEGGAAGTLTASAGTLWAALAGGDALPPELREGLINKNRIERYGTAIAGGILNASLLDEFITSEALLTAKANEELNARLKHVKIKEKKVKPQSERERDLGRHIVESWTKLDRAKWRKKNRDIQEP